MAASHLRTASLAAVLALAGCVRPEPQDRLSVGIDLDSPIIEDSGRFTFVSSVRELADGSFILTDSREGRVLHLDQRAQARREIGKRGRGPGEWQTVFPLLPLGGDSSLMAEPGNRRWSIFRGANVIVSLPPDLPAIGVTGGFVLSADGLGRVYRVFPPPLTGDLAMSRTTDDSIPFVRIGLLTGRADTLTWLADASATVELAKSADGAVVAIGISRPAFSVSEQAVAFEDGWVAVARLWPYRVDWHAPDDHWIRGAPVAEAPALLDGAERRAYLARNAESIRALARATPRVRAALARRYGEFPTAIPAFEPAALIPGMDGCLYVRRTPTAAAPDPRYDVFDRNGSRRVTLRLGTSQRLVARGLDRLYIVTMDEDDFERLSIYPSPSELERCA